MLDFVPYTLVGFGGAAQESTRGAEGGGRESREGEESEAPGTDLQIDSTNPFCR
jgi:hypothetical protein